MEDEYEVSEYYRTKNGEIFKIIDLDDYSFLLDKFYHQIVKHSKNIIDLVEVGDYVNGKEVIEVREQEGKIYLMTGYVPQTYIKEDIKSIVTHEQMASIEYKVEEDK